MIQSCRHKVLIVDDAIDNIKIFINLLRQDYDTFLQRMEERLLN